MYWLVSQKPSTTIKFADLPFNCCLLKSGRSFKLENQFLLLALFYTGYLTKAIYMAGEGGKTPPNLSLTPRSWKHQIWHTGWCSSKFLKKIGFDLMTLSLRRHGYIFRKMTSFLRLRHGGLNFVHRFVFWYWIIKCLNQVSYITKRSCDIIKLTVG